MLIHKWQLFLISTILKLWMFMKGTEGGRIADVGKKYCIGAQCVLEKISQEHFKNKFYTDKSTNIYNGSHHT